MVKKVNGKNPIEEFADLLGGLASRLRLRKDTPTDEHVQAHIGQVASMATMVSIYKSDTLAEALRHPVIERIRGTLWAGSPGKVKTTWEDLAERYKAALKIALEEMEK